VLAAAVALIVFPALSGADATNPPVVTTDPATGVTNTGAKLNGTIDPNDPDNGASYTFSWGQTTGYGTDVNGTTNPGTSAQAVSTTLTGLAPGTTYHYMLCATNAPNPPGGTNCGSDQSFTTPDAPTVAAGAATGVTTSGATLPGTVNPNGANTSAVFRYGTGCSGPSWTTGCASVSASPPPGSGRSPVGVSATLSALQAGATFHYTLCATNAYGTNCDPTDHTFVTNQPPTATLKENATSPGERQVSFDGSQSKDPDGSIQSWTLNFGDSTSLPGSGTPAANIVHTYPTAGSYTASLTVTDDDGAMATSTPVTVVVPAISIADASVNEGDTASFVVTLSAVSTHSVTVDYKTADGTAKAPGDYTATQGTLAIPAGHCGPSSTECQITVPTKEDTLYENNETFTVVLSNPTGAAIADGTATGTIIDDDPQPVVMIANNAILEGNSGSTVNSPQSWIAGGSLTLGNASGFDSAGPGSPFYLSDPGSTSATPDGPYVFSGISGNMLTGITPAGAAFAGQLAFQPVPLTFTVALCNVADSGTVDQCFQNRITSGRTTTVQFTTFNGGGADPPHTPVTSGQDYVAKCSIIVTGASCSGPLGPPITIPPGQSTATMAVSVIPNTVQQDTVRHFLLKLVSATNASIFGGNLGAGDIIDDDAANPPIATTGDPSAIGADQATVAATVNPKGEATRAFVQYGTSTAYGKQTAAQTLPADGSDHQLSFNLTGLLPSTTYHYRVVATHDATHATGYGDDKTFPTPSPSPTAKTGLANPVDAHTATIHGVVNPHGAATTAYLEYGKTTAYGLRTAAIDVGKGVVDQSVTFELNGLAAKTRYHYRVVAAHGGTKVYGGDMTFTTKPVQKPMHVSFASRKPVTVTANGLVPLALRCTGNVQKRCSSTVFLRFGKRAAGRKSIKLRPNRRTVVRVRLRPGVFSILKSKKSLVLGVTITTSDGVESAQILSGSLKILAPGTQLAAHTASTGSVVQCMTQVYKNGPVYVTSARNLTCGAAAREQRRYKWTGENTSFRTPGGYRCAPFGGGAVVYQIRCTKGVRAYRIEFAD
jgi:PKD domain